jgi:hypothetical protein
MLDLTWGTPFFLGQKPCVKVMHATPVMCFSLEMSFSWVQGKLVLAGHKNKA